MSREHAVEAEAPTINAYQGGAFVHQGDATNLPLGDETVDLIVTSPPYFALRSYTDGGEHYDGQIGSEPTPADFLVALWTVLDECWRVLKPSGSCWVNLGDKYAGGGGQWDKDDRDNNRRMGGTGNARAAYNGGRTYGLRAKSLMGLPWRWALGATCPDPYRTCYQPGDHPQWVLRAEVVWSKPNGLPESVTDRVRRSHEQWFHLTKQGRYLAAVDEVREPYLAPPAKAQTSKATLSGAHRNPTTLLDHDLEHNPLGKLPGSVWTIPSEPLRVPEHLGVDHFAAYPQEWPRRIILGWSPSGGVVLDPFGGTGTTAMVARTLGRFGIHVDLSADYNRLARWRIWESRHECKILERMWAMENDRMVDGKPKVPAKVKREILARANEMALVQRRQSAALWREVRDA